MTTRQHTSEQLCECESFKCARTFFIPIEKAIEYLQDATIALVSADCETPVPDGWTEFERGDGYIAYRIPAEAACGEGG